MGVSQYLKKYIDDGKMGEIYSARCGWQRRRESRKGRLVYDKGAVRRRSAYRLGRSYD